MGIKAGTSLTRRGRRETPQQTNNSRLKSSETSHDNHQPGRGKSPSNLFPPINFGARLFSGIGADNKSSLRRRALTDVDDLIENDMVNNEGRPLAVALTGEKKE